MAVVRRDKRAVRKPVAEGARSVDHFAVGGTEFVRLAIPLVPPLPAALTAAEREVVALILDGKSNAAIAKARGVAVRTVANQVASILRKLDVESRSALIARLTQAATTGSRLD